MGAGPCERYDHAMVGATVAMSSVAPAPLLGEPFPGRWQADWFILRLKLIVLLLNTLGAARAVCAPTAAAAWRALRPSIWAVSWLVLAVGHVIRVTVGAMAATLAGTVLCVVLYALVPSPVITAPVIGDVSMPTGPSAAFIGWAVACLLAAGVGVAYARRSQLKALVGPVWARDETYRSMRALQFALEVGASVEAALTAAMCSTRDRGIQELFKVALDRVRDDASLGCALRDAGLLPERAVAGWSSRSRSAELGAAVCRVADALLRGERFVAPPPSQTPHRRWVPAAGFAVIALAFGLARAASDQGSSVGRATCGCAPATNHQECPT